MSKKRMPWEITEDRRNIFVVGVFNHPISDVRVMGWFDSERAANVAVKNNAGDIHEEYYEWAVVERFKAGFYPLCITEDAMWYRWDGKRKKYIRKSKAPPVVQKLGVFNLTLR